MNQDVLIQSIEKEQLMLYLLNINMKKMIPSLKKDLEKTPYFFEKKFQEFQEVNWLNKDFLQFKKYYLNIEYLNNFIYVWTIIFDSHKEIFFLKDIAEKLTKIIENVKINQYFFDQLNFLKENVKNQKNKILYTKWFEFLFINDNQTLENEKKHFQIEKRIQKQIDLLEENNEKSLFDQKSIFYVPSEKKDILKGLTYDLLKIGKVNAIGIKKEGWVFYLYDDITVDLLLKNLENRNIRKNIYEKYQKLNGDLYGNMNYNQILSQVLNKKQKLAKILNKNNYLELVLSDFVLNTPKKVLSYLSKIELEIHDIVEKSKQEIKEYAIYDHITIIKPWDILYYYHKIVKNYKFIKDKEFNQYFQYKPTFEKILLFFEKNFQIQFKLEKEENHLLYYKIIDLKSKNNSYFIINPYGNNYYEMNISSYEEINKKTIPNVQYISLNITNKYLSFEDIKCILHEFGHAFHDFFAKEYKLGILNEINQTWDLIELPSKFLEFFAYNKEFLKLISEHYQSKEKINDIIIDKIFQKNEFFNGYELYKNIQKYKAKISLYQTFKPNSKKNPYNLIKKNLENDGIIYNILRENHLSNYKNDYSPTEYIYLFCEQLAYPIYETLINNKGLQKKGSMRNIYIKIFNAQEKYSKILPKYIDLKITNTIKMLQKNANIELYGMNYSFNKQKNLLKTILG